MSIHAQISPEAAAALSAQRRNSTIASIIVGLLLMALLCLIFMLLKDYIYQEKVEPIVSFRDDSPEEVTVEPTKVTNSIKKTPSSPSSNATPVIVANAISTNSIPVPEITTESLSADFGETDGFGEGFGDGFGSGFGNGSGGGFAALPNSMKKRCSPQERLVRLKEMGGDERCEEAVVKALRWMKNSQNDNGSWSNKEQVGMTALSVLAYLGHCETPLSVEFGETVENAIVYLIDVAIKNKGRLATDMKAHSFAYEHAIGSYALAEAYTFCNIINYEIEGLEEAVTLVINTVIKGQANTGCWNYGYTSARTQDLSTTAWAMQALKAAKSSGLDFPKLNKAAKAAIDAIKKNQASDGGFGYKGPRPPGIHKTFTLTGAGVLCHQQWGEGNKSHARKGIKWIDKNSKFKWGTATADIYGHYYNGQAMMEAGGGEWKRYNALFMEETLGGQADDGSFRVPGGIAPGNFYNTNLHYRTCLATLMLEVYYRFLPGTGNKK